MVDTERMKKGFWAWAAEVLHTSSKTITALVIVAAFAATIGMWMYDNLLADRLSEEVRKLSGAPEIITAVEAVDEKVEAQGSRIERLGRQVAAITPPPVITEYDPVRSRAFGICVPGEACQVQLRFRRTLFGSTCGTPALVNRTFVDSNGLVTSPRPAEGNRISKAGTEWTVRSVGFIVPLGVTPGLGEFYMLLEYPDCEAETPDGRTLTIPVTEEETYRAPVVIKEKDAD